MQEEHSLTTPGRKSVAATVRESLERIWKRAEILAIVGAALLLLLLQIPWLRDAFKSAGLENSENLRTTIIVVIVTALFFEVLDLARGVTGLVDSGRRFFADPLDVYPALIERAERIRSSKERTLDVLGMTLYTAWPSLCFWLERMDTANWHVRLAAMDDPAGKLDYWVPERWKEQSKANLEAIRAIAEEPALIQRGIAIEAYGYDFLPAVHGFRLGNGDVFISVLLWQPDGKLGYAPRPYSYLLVPGTDQTDAAHAYRMIFDAWFTRACTTSAP